MTVLNAAGLDPLKSWTWCVLSLVWGTTVQTRDAGGCGVTPGMDVGLLSPTVTPSTDVGLLPPPPGRGAAAGSAQTQQLDC